MRHIKFTLQYDGTDYSGWQIQKKETTIQGLLENAVFTVTGERLRIPGAARTDAGVHALEQVVSFKTRCKLKPQILARAVNAYLPQDIRVIDAEEVGEDFHPRHSARSKTYSYLISRTGDYSVFLRRYSWQMRYQLNCNTMREAAGYLIGEHDFSCFRASGCNSKNPVREIKEIKIYEFDTFDFMTFTFNVPIIKISVEANAFLRHMVRIIVGTLADIGRGKISPEKMKEILESKDRRVAGRTAPACGLFLEKIIY
jgi:tRNA pseudouridine38-40 synthase